MKKTDISKVIAATKHPSRVTMAVCKDEKGNFNAITLEWFMRTSINPPMFAISIGHQRYSYNCLQKNRYFNLCFPSKQLKESVVFCGTKSGRDFDKFKETKMDWFPGKLAGYPVIKGAVATFECEIVSQVKSGDHTIYAGEVKHAFLDKSKELLLAENLS